MAGGGRAGSAAGRGGGYLSDGAAPGAVAARLPPGNTTPPTPPTVAGGTAGSVVSKTKSAAGPKRNRVQRNARLLPNAFQQSRAPSLRREGQGEQSGQKCPKTARGRARIELAEVAASSVLPLLKINGSPAPSIFTQRPVSFNSHRLLLAFEVTGKYSTNTPGEMRGTVWVLVPLRPTDYLHDRALF